MISETIPIHSPLLKVWIYNQLKILFTVYSVHAEILPSGLKLHGKSESVTQLGESMNILSNKFQCKIIQFSGVIPLLRQYGKGSLLEIDESVQKQIDQLGLNIRGIYLFSYPTTISEELIEVKLYKQLIHRLVLDSEQILKIVLMNVLSYIQQDSDCYVGIQSYGLYFNGCIQSIEKGYNTVLQHIHGHSIHYLYSSKQHSVPCNQEVIHQVQNKIKTVNLVWFDDQAVEQLYQNLPVLESYVMEMRKERGRFLAVICTGREISTVEDIRKEFQSLMQSSRVDPCTSPGESKSDPARLSTDPSSEKSSEPNSVNSSDKAQNKPSPLPRRGPRILNKGIKSAMAKAKLLERQSAMERETVIEQLDANISEIEIRQPGYQKSIQQQLCSFLNIFNQRTISGKMDFSGSPQDLKRAMKEIMNIKKQFEGQMIERVEYKREDNEISINIIIKDRMLPLDSTCRKMEKVIYQKLGARVTFREVGGMGFQ